MLITFPLPVETGGQVEKYPISDRMFQNGSAKKVKSPLETGKMLTGE
jgi:hypothetical protein